MHRIYTGFSTVPVCLLVTKHLLNHQRQWCIHTLCKVSFNNNNYNNYFTAIIWPLVGTFS